MILIGFLVSIQFVSCTSREKRDCKLEFSNYICKLNSPFNQI